MQSRTSRSARFLGLAFLALAMATYFLLGVHALVRFAGVACALTGLYWVVTRRIPVGWEGQPPSFHVTGVLAVSLGVVMVVFGISLVYFAPVAACVLGWSESSAC